MREQLHDRPTLGLEEEVFVVHGETGMPASIPERCREELILKLQSRCQFEYKACVLELVTRLPHDDPRQLIHEAAANRCEANAILAPFELKTLALASHPTAVVDDLPARENDERYRRIEKFKGDAVRGLAVNGVHLHVGTYGSAERLDAIPVLMQIAPLHAALTACSPWFDGRDTGQASWRLRVLTRLAAPMPVLASTTEELLKFQQALSAAGGPADASEHWGLVRLGAGKPTIEFRAADTAPELDILTGLVALTASAAYAVRKRWIARPKWSDGMALSIYHANFDIVAAHGAAAKLIDPFDLTPKCVTEYAGAWVERSANAIDALNFGSAINEFMHLVDSRDPAQYIRATMAQVEQGARASGLSPSDATSLAGRRVVRWAWGRAKASLAASRTMRASAAA